MDYVQLSDWDPLSLQNTDQGLVIAAKRREILNILKSYTGWYDLFSELIQNSLDAVERRAKERISGYEPTIWITVNMEQSSISVTDNGCGMNPSQFEQFLQPNFSFKDGTTTRGKKGVGATYLAYGFNHLEVATKWEGKVYSGVLKGGREWLEDKTDTIARPKITYAPVSHIPFYQIDRGTSMTLKLTGPHIRPTDLGYNQAKTADQWLAVLQVKTPLGGIYICGDKRPNITVHLEAIHPRGGETTQVTTTKAEYLYPHVIFGRTKDLRDYLSYQKKQIERNQDVSRLPAKYRKLNGLWGEWTGEQILDNTSPISHRLSSEEQERVRALGIRLYIFLGYSTEQWDEYNDNRLKLRKGIRLLKGGLQLATKNMPQGDSLTIPMTNNIGFQNIAHVIVHLDNAEPDLGRKGFQPEDVDIAEKLAVSAVTAFRRYFPRMLRKSTGAPVFQQEVKISDWKAQQREYEKEFPLIITGAGLFQPTEELPIRSLPRTEQDVVALFNQMLSSGLIRGIQLLSSSQYKQYDGLFRVIMEPPFEKFLLSFDNPLGVDPTYFEGIRETVGSLDHLEVLEYKFNLDALIEEFKMEEKSPSEVDLVVAWAMGTRWKESFDVMSYLDPDNVHHRERHGLTQKFFHSTSGERAFEAIILEDLVSFLTDPHEEIARQREQYASEGYE
jgi:hypothetical protein